MMTKMISLTMLTLNMSLIFTSTPLPLGLIIIMMALNITLLLSFICSSWLSLTIFIIYIGGLLVLFAYFLSIQPNLILSLSKILMKSILIMSILFQMMNTNTTVASFSKILMPMPTIMSYSNMPLVILMGGVLLLILIVVVSLSFETKSTLRPFN